MSLAYGGSVLVQKLGVLVAIAGAPRNVFTITGACRVIQLYGYISTAISANATALDMTFLPTAGTIFALAASTTVTSETVGTVVNVTFDLSDTLNIADGYAPQKFSGATFFGGTIIQGTTGAGATTGAVDWYCEYVPQTPGANIVAA